MDADRAKVFAEEIDKVQAGMVPPVAVAGEPVEQLPTVKKAPQAKAKGRPRKARTGVGSGPKSIAVKRLGQRLGQIPKPPAISYKRSKQNGEGGIRTRTDGPYNGLSSLLPCSPVESRFLWRALSPGGRDASISWRK